MKPFDTQMNKQHYIVDLYWEPKSFVEKIFPKKAGKACIWPSNNWVEIHLFEDIKIKTETYEVDYVYDFMDVSAHQFYMKRHLRTDGVGNEDISSWVDAEYAVCSNRISSFIISRKKVFGNFKKIFCNPSKKDYKRWNEWHPKDDFPGTVFLWDVENTVKRLVRGAQNGPDRWVETFITHDLTKHQITTKYYDEGK